MTVAGDSPSLGRSLSPDCVPTLGYLYLVASSGVHIEELLRVGEGVPHSFVPALEADTSVLARHTLTWDAAHL